jgi:hypothetical protein
MSVEDDRADRDFEQRARADLRRGIEQTPHDVRVRLDAIVARALTQTRRPRMIRFALPAAAVAVIAGIFVAQPWRGADAPPAPAADDFALLIDGDNLDLAEQMEFYQWLNRQPGILDDAAAPAPAQRS